MATITQPTSGVSTDSRRLVEMNWDPITRIVGSLGIYTKIDFAKLDIRLTQVTAAELVFALVAGFG